MHSFSRRANVEHRRRARPIHDEIVHEVRHVHLIHQRAATDDDRDRDRDDANEPDSSLRRKPLGLAAARDHHRHRCSGRLSRSVEDREFVEIEHRRSPGRRWMG
jgi:hypothetical protein